MQASPSKPTPSAALSAARRMTRLLVARYALEWGVGLSLLLHVLLLSVHFVMPDARNFSRPEKGLDVVLVNSRHAHPPDKADLLAQTNLDGGGTDARQGHLSSPLPPQQQTRAGDGLVEAQKRNDLPQPAQVEAMTVAKSKAPLSVDTRQTSPTEAPRQVSGYDLLDSSAAVARIEAQIDKELGEQSTRPRRKFIGASTHEYRDAQYVEDWRQKIERVGNLNYPALARGKYYGSLLLSVTIRADGTVHDIEIHRSSGSKLLDDSARRIVQLAAPYAAFPPDIRRDTDEIVITRTWTFTNSDSIKTEKAE